MKLLMISGDRSLLAGTDSAFRRTLEGFAPLWERIDIICPKSGAKTSTQVLPTVYVHPSPWPLFLQPLWIFRMGKRLIADHKHLVMTVHDYPPFYNGLGAWILHKATKIRYALEVHHVVGVPQAAGVMEWIGRMLSWLFLRFDARSALAVRTVAGTVDDTLRRYGVPADKITRVPSFYLDDTLRPDPTIKKAYDFVFAGRLVSNKGLPRLLQAMELLPNATLLIIGDGPRRRAWERLTVRKKLQDRVTFVGWLPTHAEVLASIQSARALVMCSLSEGGPRVALEALACGVPVIATPVGVMSDVIQDGVNGFLTRADAGDLRALMGRLLDDAALQSRMSTAAPRVREQFDRQTLLRAYAEFLQRLA